MKHLSISLPRVGNLNVGFWVARDHVYCHVTKPSQSGKVDSPLVSPCVFSLVPESIAIRLRFIATRNARASATTHVPQTYLGFFSILLPSLFPVSITVSAIGLASTLNLSDEQVRLTSP